MEKVEKDKDGARESYFLSEKGSHRLQASFSSNEI